MADPRGANRSKRRRRWILALILLALLGAGFWFYKVYFVSTDLAIRNAEAFSFRRMTVSQLAEQGEYLFFYATNRRAGADATVL